MARARQSGTEMFAILREFDDRRAHPGKLVAGVDEAGRGPLAGPVVASAVILNPDMPLEKLPGLGDSKTLAEADRERLYDLIQQHCLCLGVGVCGPEIIDERNILQASLLAMCRAVEGLTARPDLVLVDGNQTPAMEHETKCIIKGDSLSASIAAASIIAKVTRDRMMQEMHSKFPHYRFDRNKGYPTQYHCTALEVFGVSKIHRRSFGPVALAPPSPKPSRFFREAYDQLSAVLHHEALTPLEAMLESSGRKVSKAERYILGKLCEYRREDLAKSPH